jgi:hypothetical protein
VRGSVGPDLAEYEGGFVVQPGVLRRCTGQSKAGRVGDREARRCSWMRETGNVLRLVWIRHGDV